MNTLYGDLLRDGGVVAVTVVKQNSWSWLKPETIFTLPAKQGNGFGLLYPHVHMQSHSSTDKW